MTPGIIAHLRALRIESGLPLKAVAYDLGVSIWWLCQIEHGRGKVKPLQLERWAVILGADVAIAKKIAPAKRKGAC